MDDVDLKVLGYISLIVALILSWLVLSIFGQDIRAFMDYHFTPEFRILILKWFVLSLWMSLTGIGLILLAYVKIKERMKNDNCV